MVCLETDFLVDLLRKKPDAIKKLEQLTKENAELTVTPITLTELFNGAFLHAQIEKIDLVEEICFSLKILSYDFLASKKAGELLARLEKQGEKIGDFDTITAGIAVRYGEKIITKNRKHFKKIKELKIESW